VLVDSSVIVAAVARPGVCAQFLDELVDGHVWVASRFVLDEVARKLRDKFGVPRADVAAAVRRIKGLAEIVTAADVPASACRDPQDLPVLGAALGGRADLLVTVDRDLLDLGRWADIPIVKPGEAFHRLRAAAG
jgi:putative PIN family toxin of toxin-antitoxin system